MSEFEFKGTPGPWVISGANRCDTYSLGVQSALIRYEHMHICDVCDDGVACGFEDANAQLIAAAPELFEALKEMTRAYTELVNCGDCGRWNPENDGEVMQARAALTKATAQEHTNDH